MVISLGYAFYTTMVLIPALEEMFSARSLIATYIKERKDASEPIAEFTQTWKSRSIKFYMPFDELKDKYHYSHYRLNNDESSVRRFWQENKDHRVFIIIEQKQKHFTRINALWQQVSGGEQLIKIDDDTVANEPYKAEFWLLSNRDLTGKAQRLSPEQMQAQMGESVRMEPFNPSVKSSIVFDDEIELVGWEPLPAKHKVGEDLTMTLYFKALKNVSREYQIFVHAEHDKNFRLIGDHTPVDGQFSTSRWQAGQYIKDVYRLDVPVDSKEGRLEVLVGLFTKNERARIVRGDQDQENRTRIGTTELIH